MRISGDVKIKIHRKIMKSVSAHKQFLTNYTYSFSLLLFMKNQCIPFCELPFLVLERQKQKARTSGPVNYVA